MLSKRGDMGTCVKAWTTIRNHAGVHKDWHTCKTTAMTKAIDEGMTDQQLMAHFSHEDIRSVKHYSNSNAATKKAWANKVVSGI